MREIITGGEVTMDFFKTEDPDVERVDGVSWIPIRTANRILRERAQPVWGIYRTQLDFELHRKRYDWSTHTALVIGIEPVEKDDAERILKDLARGLGTLGAYEELIDRAKRLLASSPSGK